MTDSNEEALKSYSQYIHKDSFPDTPEKYIELFRALAAVANLAVDKLELHDRESENDFQKTRTKVSYLVESLANLRGQLGIIVDERPSLSGTDYQSEMYKVEDYLMYRLQLLGHDFREI